jgi:hypothetical protein
MPRYIHIHSLKFGEVEIPLPLSVRITRKTLSHPAADECELFPANIQISRNSLQVEIRTRAVAVAESFALGLCDRLEFTTQAAQSHFPQRKIWIDSALLTDVEVVYEQRSPATAVLRFEVESPDGNVPFTTEELQHDPA